MSRLSYFKVIAQHCIVRICGMISTVRVAFNNAYRKYLVYLSGVVPVRCMQTTISVTLKQV